MFPIFYNQWGYFETGIYTGSPDEREPILNDFKLGRIDIRMSFSNVLSLYWYLLRVYEVVTSFDTARTDISLLDSLPFSVIFVDEAHKLKNTKSKITLAFSQFKPEAVRFGLTGTAIQNSYNELWTLLNWSCPGQMGDEKQWKLAVAKPLAIGQSASATDEERAIGRVSPFLQFLKVFRLNFY